MTEPVRHCEQHELPRCHVGLIDVRFSPDSDQIAGVDALLESANLALVTREPPDSTQRRGDLPGMRVIHHLETCLQL